MMYDVMQFVAEEEIKVMSWRAQSPDLNPIENIWQILKIKFHQRFTNFFVHCQSPKEQWRSMARFSKKFGAR